MAKKVKGVGGTKAAEELGIGRSTFYDWEAKGIVVRFPDDSVDVPATAKNAAANIDPAKSPAVAAQAPGRPRPPAPEGPSTPADVQAAIDALAAIPDLDLNECRTLKEYWTSELRRMEAEQKRGALVPVEDVERAWGEVTRAIRSRFQASPQRMLDALLTAGVIVGGTTRATVETILCEQVDAVLSDISDNPPAVQ